MRSGMDDQKSEMAPHIFQGRYLERYVRSERYAGYHTEVLVLEALQDIVMALRSIDSTLSAINEREVLREHREGL